MTGPATRGLAVDVLAEAVEERRFARDHRAPLELAENAEAVELRARVRQDVDADAERRHVGRCLVDAAGDAGLVEAERERQAADAGADDDDIVGTAAGSGAGHESL